MGQTRIEYATKSWSPVVGCSPSGSPGCLNCWARELHNRRHKAFVAGKKMPAQYAKPFAEVQCLPERLNEPLHWQKPQRVAVAFGGDLFHDDVPDHFLHMVFAAMELTNPFHTFLLLTKRLERMADFMLQRQRESNGAVDCRIWLGTSISTQADADRNVPHLRRCPAALRFLSTEPLLENLVLDLTGIGFVIVGSESGPHRRPCKLDWIRSIRDQCQAAEVALFVKQADIEGRLVKMPVLDGTVWSEFPLDAESKTND